MRTWMFFYFLCLVFEPTLVVAANLHDMVDGMKVRAEGYPVSGVNDASRLNGDQAEAAKRVFDVFNSPGYTERMKKESNRIMKDVLKVTPAPYYYADADRAQSPQLAPDERIYIFISSSVPTATLRSYARDIDRIGDPRITMVMRGMVGGMGKMRPTMEFISKIILKNPDCAEPGCKTLRSSVIIDPLLFRLYRPERVPAIVYVHGLSAIDPDLSEGDSANGVLVSDSQWLMTYGDNSLGYSLATFRENGGSPILEELAGLVGN